MLHSFTRNYNDLSTEAGFQFEFFCDCCGNGFKSTFKESTTFGQKSKSERFGRMASNLGSLLGGRMNDLGWALERGSDAINSKFNNESPQWRKEYEENFDNAQAEIQSKFKKCPSCNKWVCVDCWNEDDELCTECAPREASYVAKARSTAMQRNIDEAAETATVWTGKLEKQTTVCPECGKPAGNGKFCNNCGASLEKNKCSKCGAVLTPGMKFCGECGSPTNVKPVCSNCGTESEPGTKFCPECGTKL